MSKLIEDFVQTMSMIVDHGISQADFDRTIQATIISCEDEIKGIYKIKYQDSIWKAYVTNKDVKYKSGNLVYVLIPKNDSRLNKTIIGPASADDTDLSNSYPTMEDNFIQNGQNLIQNSITMFSLCSYKNMTQEYEIYNSEINNNILNINSNYETYLSFSDFFILKAKFRTNIIEEEQRQRGNYGVAVYIKYKEDEPDVKYVLDVDSMKGDPYFFISEVSQQVYFKINKELFSHISKITIFNNSFLLQDNLHEDDIFITDIQIIGANYLSEQVRNGNTLLFSYPRGYIFTSEDLQQTTKQIVAQIRINNRIVTSGLNNIPFYWYQEDKTVIPGQEFYESHGGKGWKCLNKKQENDFISEQNNLIISKSDIITKKMTFKCVAIYSGIQIENTFNIINLDNEYEINISVQEPGEFSQSIDTLHLTCSVKKSGIVYNDINFIWSEEDEYGNFSLLSENNNLSQIEISSQNIINYKNYFCTVMTFENSLIGVASIRVYKKINDSPLYTLSLVNGNQVFSYDEEGNSYFNNEEENYTIPLLSFNVLDNKTQKDITQQVLSQGQVIWEIPIKNTLLIDMNNTEETQNQEIENELDYVTYEQLRNITFNIMDKYNINKKNNNIKLSIIYNSVKLTTQTNFLFIKQGQPGTSGDGMVCKIFTLNNNERVKDWFQTTVIFSSSGLSSNPEYIYNWNGPFYVELWRGNEKLFSGNQSATLTSGDNVQVKWEILSHGDNTWYEFDENNAGILSFNKEVTNIEEQFQSLFSEGCPANIVKVTVQYRGRKYYDFIPIVTIFCEDNNENNLHLKSNSGFKQVIYTSDGENPQYSNTFPFAIEEEDNLLYSWHVIGSILTGSSYTNIYNLQKTLGGLIEITNKEDEDYYSNILKEKQKFFKPTENYDGKCVTHAIVIKSSDNLFRGIHIPIHFCFNPYGQKWLNEWDGNSISIDEENNFILAPKIGAGFKENNLFTGMFMGLCSNRSENKDEIGLFGYNSGIRTFFLDAETGKTEFGKRGRGQIILDPGSANRQDTAQIYGGNYVAYSNNTEGSGMLIDLTTPAIKFGSGKFEVNAQGQITAKEGYIGPWQIINNCLYHGSSNNPSLGTKNSADDDIYLGLSGVSLGNKLIYNSTTGEFNLNVSSLSIGNKAIKDSRNLFLKSYLIKKGGYVTLLQDWDSNYTYKIRCLNSDGHDKYCIIKFNDLKLQVNKTYTFSFKFKKISSFENTGTYGTNTSNFNDNSQLNHLSNISLLLDGSYGASKSIIVLETNLDGEQKTITSSNNIIPLQDSYNQHFIYMSFKVISLNYLSGDQNSLFIYFNKGDNQHNVDIQLSQIMVEEGTPASSWVPAKADMSLQNFIWYDADNGVIIYNGQRGLIKNNTLLGLSDFNIRLINSEMGIYKGRLQKLASYGGSSIIFYDGGYTTGMSSEEQLNHRACYININGLNIKKGTINLGNKFIAESNGSLSLGDRLIYNANDNTLTLSLNSLSIGDQQLDPTRSEKNLFSQSNLSAANSKVKIEQTNESYNYKVTYETSTSGYFSNRYLKIDYSNLDLEKNKIYTFSFVFSPFSNETNSSTLTFIYDNSHLTNSKIQIKNIYLNEIDLLKEGLYDTTNNWIDLNHMNSLGYYKTNQSNIIELVFSLNDIPADNYKHLRIYFNKNNTSQAIVNISNIMLQRNYRASKWEPSREDYLLDIKKASKTATNYIWYDSTHGIIVYDGQQSVITSSDLTNLQGYNLRIDNNSLDIYKGKTTLLASYGQSTIFYNQNGNACCTIGATGMDIVKGSITLGTNFTVTSNGTLTAKKGTIGNFTFQEEYIRGQYERNNITYTIALRSLESSDIALRTRRTESNNSTPVTTFQLKYDGEIITNSNIILDQPGSNDNGKIQYQYNNQPYDLVSITSDARTVNLGNLNYATNICFRTLTTTDDRSIQFWPYYNDTVKLGTAANRWLEVHACHGYFQYSLYLGNNPISTSDQKKKNIIGNLKEYKSLFMDLKPIQFTWKDSNKENNSQIHFGIGARYTKTLIQQYNFKNLALVQNINEDYAVNYTELLMLSVPIIQQHQTQIQQLKQQIINLKNIIKELKGD